MADSPYAVATNLASRDFSGRRVLVIGSGPMGTQHLKALRTMGVLDITVVTMLKESAGAVATEFGADVRVDRVEAALRDDESFDLVVVATPIETLLDVTRHVLARGHRNILLEKPGSLWSAELERFARESGVAGARIRLAYNRNVYPNLILLEELAAKEGGITWCRYTFTEWASRIDFTKNPQSVYERWGISNSLHPIGMAHRLIGMPDRLSAERDGRLDWHPAGSRFSGGGHTVSGVPFEFEADWNSTGRWTVQLGTAKSAYRLIPLETLSVCAVGSDEWTPVDFAAAYPEAKPGLAEELAVMLDPSLERALPLPDLNDGVALVRLAEEIFGYPRDRKASFN